MLLFVTLVFAMLVFTTLVPPTSETAPMRAMGVVRPLVTTGVDLPLLAALPNWFMLDTSRIVTAAALLEVGGENSCDVTSSPAEEDDGTGTSGWEEVDWLRLVLFEEVRALSGEKNKGILLPS